MHSRPTSTAWARQLLLLLAVLLGTVAMHSLGHPMEAGPSHANGSVSVASVSVASDQAAHDRALLNHAPPGAVQADPSSHSAGHAPMGGMDPLTVCVAVLAAWVVLTLIAWGGLRPAGFLALARGRLLRDLLAVPPPRRTVLDRLSVLRI